MHTLEQVNVIKATTSFRPVVNKNHGKALDVKLERTKPHNGSAFMGPMVQFLVPSQQNLMVVRAVTISRCSWAMHLN
jgi:hypothetical protein